ncbi:MAG: hypothetical protein HRF49_12225 [bacterium]|jgi:hypothetical protein
MAKVGSTGTLPKTGRNSSARNRDGAGHKPSVHIIERIEGDEGTVVFSPPLEAKVEWDGKFYKASALDGDVVTFDKLPEVAEEELEVVICMSFFRFRNLPDERLDGRARRIRDKLVAAASVPD